MKRVRHEEEYRLHPSPSIAIHVPTSWSDSPGKEPRNYQCIGHKPPFNATKLYSRYDIINSATKQHDTYKYRTLHWNQEFAR